jgi:DNA-binding transcriptional LysR family regulator
VRRVFDHFFVTLQAVADGLGIGVGPLPVLQADLDQHRLITPFEHQGFPDGLRRAHPFRRQQNTFIDKFHRSARFATHL